MPWKMTIPRKKAKTSQWPAQAKALAIWTLMMTMTTMRRKRKVESKWENFQTALILLFTNYSLSTPVNQNMASLSLAASSGETGSSMPMPEGLIPVGNAVAA